MENVAAVEEKIAFIEMLVCEAKERALEAEQEFQQMKRLRDAAVEEVIRLDKKLKEAMEWLASMRKRMIEARQQEARVTEEARVERLPI